MRALVIGGSLGGLLCANLLARRGWEVEVFEQASKELAGRGAGIISHPELFQTLEAIGVPLDDSYGVDIPLRGTFDRGGALIATLESQQVFTSWGRLYQLLKAAFPADCYRFGHSLESLAQDASGVTACAPTSISVESRNRPSWISPTLAVVPPMSNERTLA